MSTYGLLIGGVSLQQLLASTAVLEGVHMQHQAMTHMGSHSMHTPSSQQHLPHRIGSKQVDLGVVGSGVPWGRPTPTPALLPLFLGGHR